MDSTSKLEEHNLRFFLVCTHSVAGALPLGIMLTSDEKEATMHKALDMLCNILPAGAFYSRGASCGPQVVMTDNCTELRQVIREKWSSTTLLLCVFHILQQVWRRLYDKKHGISPNGRVEIMKMFRILLYSKTEEELDLFINKLNDEETIISKYVSLQSYLNELFDRKAEWAVYYRSELLIRGSNTNNYCEAQFLVLKVSKNLGFVCVLLSFCR